MEHDTSGGGEVAKRGPGHPLEYDRAAVVEAICEGLAQGVPLEELCRGDGMPSARSVHDWKRSEPDIAAPIARAREAGADMIAQRLRLTARGKGPEEGGDSTGDVARDKLICDTDLKLLAKWFPATYGDRVALTNARGDGDATLRVEAILADELAGLLNVTPKALSKAAEALPASAPPRD
jgi:hypothetical protein